MKKFAIMMKRYVGMLLLLMGGVALPVSAVQPYIESVPKFNRLTSRVMIRTVEQPTLANLDYAAYDRNPVLLDPPPGKTGARRTPLTEEELAFGGTLASVKYTLREVTLTAAERQHPLAWKPLMKKLWNVVKDDHLAAAADRINAKKWSEDAAYQPYQEVVTAYLHDADGTPELWVKIECAPWSTLYKNVSDEDGDGVRELYGRLESGMVKDSLAKAVAWIRSEYCSRVLSRNEALDWVTDLASYWYPTRNTDILAIAPDSPWPDAIVKKQIRRETGSVTVKNPLAVVEGKPFSPDKPVYNVFIIPEVPAERPRAEKNEAVTVTAAQAVPSLSNGFPAAFIANRSRLSDELVKYGSWQHWVNVNTPFYAALKGWVATFPQEQMGIPGNDGWLFFRRSFDAIFGGDLTLQPDSLNPLVHITAFRNYLSSQGIDLLFVAVPDKEEVYYAETGAGAVRPKVPVIKPYGRKLLSSLQDAGVEVVDLLTPFMAAAARDSAAGEAVYQKQDTHWTGRGMQIAADRIASRIAEYPWRHSFTDTISYTFSDTAIVRAGDIVERLPPEKQADYKPVSMPARRVLLPDGTAYRGNLPDAPILLIGDSFTGVFESIDCKSAGVGAHIAARTRVPVDIITSWGGGPMVRQKMLRARGKVLGHKRLVIYMMVARDLYNYAQGWEPLSVSAPVSGE